MLKVGYLGRIEYEFQKSRVTGPWDHTDSVSAKKVKKKISCLCTFNSVTSEPRYGSGFSDPYTGSTAGPLLSGRRWRPSSSPVILSHSLSQTQKTAFQCSFMIQRPAPCSFIFQPSYPFVSPLRSSTPHSSAPSPSSDPLFHLPASLSFFIQSQIAPDLLLLPNRAACTLCPFPFWPVLLAPSHSSLITLLLCLPSLPSLRSLLFPFQPYNLSQSPDPLLRAPSPSPSNPQISAPFISASRSLLLFLLAHSFLFHQLYSCSLPHPAPFLILFLNSLAYSPLSSCPLLPAPVPSGSLFLAPYFAGPFHPHCSYPFKPCKLSHSVTFPFGLPSLLLISHSLCSLLLPLPALPPPLLSPSTPFQFHPHSHYPPRYVPHCSMLIPLPALLFLAPSPLLLSFSAQIPVTCSFSF
jgi:hypothetical protein